MVNRKRLQLSPSLEQPERKRGRPAGKNRAALSETERRARNATYERERRGIEAALMADLAQAALLDPNMPKMVILDEAAKRIARGRQERTNCDITELRKINAKLILQIKDAKARLCNENSDAQESMTSDSEEEDLSSVSHSEEKERYLSSSSDIEGDLASDSDTEAEDIGAMRTRHYSGRKTAAGEYFFAENTDITAAEVALSDIPPEFLLSDTAIPHDLDAFLFETSTGSFPSFSSVFSEEGSMSTRPFTAGRNTPAQG